MFNDQYGLTQAVLDRRKTQTRRIITPQPIYDESCGISWKGYSYGINFSGIKGAYDNFIDGTEYDKLCKRYRVGEVVAIAQSYRNCDGFCKNGMPRWEEIAISVGAVSAGWGNKMFVRAELMPHQIRITNVRIQHLQEISDEDCLKEGVELNTRQYEHDGTKYYCVRGLGHWRGIGCYNFHSPREAYAALIDKICGKGTWDRNPYVFAYDFELIK